jgi:hypothetical protein
LSHTVKPDQISEQNSWREYFSSRKDLFCAFGHFDEEPLSGLFFQVFGWCLIHANFFVKDFECLVQACAEGPVGVSFADEADGFGGSLVVGGEEGVDEYQGEGGLFGFAQKDRWRPFNADS